MPAVLNKFIILGMINEVMIGVEEGGADFAIADLSVTSGRNEAVQFSIPWMNLGKVTIELVMTYPQEFLI